MADNDKPVILDTEDSIKAFFMLQIYYKLKMEVAMPAGPRWSVPPMRQAQGLLRQAGIKPKGRKKAVLEQYHQLLRDLKILKDA